LSGRMLELLLLGAIFSDDGGVAGRSLVSEASIKSFNDDVREYLALIDREREDA